jgi:hypothetical protein
MEITKEYLTVVCKMGQGKACCRYIIVDPDKGIICGKDDPSIKLVLDKRVPRMTAQGDNCEGWDSYQRTLNS